MFSRLTELRWIAAILNPSRRRRPSRKHRSPRRPELERLEDRTVPSVAFLGTELQISPGPAGEFGKNSIPSAGMDAAGNSIVVWQAPAGVLDTTPTPITGRLYDPTGTPLTDPFVIESGTAAEEGALQPVAMDATGGFVVAANFNTTLSAYVYDATGTLQNVLYINQEFNTPSVAITPTGFAVFWDSDDAFVHGWSYDTATSTGQYITIAEPQTVLRPSVVSDSAGNLVVVYTGTTGSSMTTGGVFAQRIDPNGNAVGAPVSLTVTTGTSNRNAVAAPLPGGGFAVAWVNQGDANGALDSAAGVYVRRFNADGTPQDNPFLLDGSTGDAPAIATDAAGDVVVTWSDTSNIFAQTFDMNGTPQEAVFQVNRTVQGTEADPTVAFSPTGDRFLIALTNNSTGPYPLPVSSTEGSSVVGDLFTIGTHQAPVVDPTATPALTYVKENDANPPGDTVSSVFGPAITLPDVGEQFGIAVTGVTDTTDGTWQYSPDAGTTWIAFGAVAPSAALLLPGTDLVRFLPNTGFLGIPTLSFHAWDGTTGTAGGTADLTAGTGGTTAFSTAVDTATLAVTPTGNYAPVLDPTYAAAFSDVLFNATSPPGNTVAQVVGNSITDRNPGALQGIAITAATGTADGTWEYSLDGGTTWTAMPVASLSVTSALLLRATDMARFVPSTEVSSTVTISYRAWDQTQGSAGTLADTTVVDPVVGAAGSAFSAAQATATELISRFSLSGSTLDVYGTPGNDTFSFVDDFSVDSNGNEFSDGFMTVTLNGETHQYQGGNNLTVNFYSGGGIDTANIDMQYTSTTGCGCDKLWGTATIGDGFTTLTKAGGPLGEEDAWVYTVNLFNVPKVYISGGIGDVVQMVGSTSGPNTFVATPTYSYLVGPTNQFYVVGGVGGVIRGIEGRTNGAVYAYGNGPAAGDQAYFYGSGGMDTFVASGSAYSYLSGTGFFNVAAGFSNVQMLSGGGQAIAYFLDSPGNDTFYGSAASCYMSGPGYINEGVDFALVYAESFVGGTDYAYNLDPAHVQTAGFAGVFYP